jgi:hypothetical protein
LAAVQENLEHRDESTEVVEHWRTSLGSRIRRFFGATAH